MRKTIREIIPSMFQRRLLLLFVVAVFTTVVIAGQTVRLTTGPRADEARHDAESLLVQRQFIPTIRAAILDRNGHILAEDRPSYELAVDYDVINGRWVNQQAVSEAIASHRNDWKEADPAKRYEMIARYEAKHQQRLDDFWNTISQLTQTPRQTIEAQKQDIIQRVQRIGERYRIHLYDELVAIDEDADWSEVIREKVADEVQPHAIVFDLDQAARFEFERLINDAKLQGQKRIDSDDPQVKLQRFDDPLYLWQSARVASSTQRHYPMHTMQVEVSRTTLPMEIASDEPVMVTVKGVGMHVIGRMAQGIDPDAYREKPFTFRDENGQIKIDLAGYRPNDRMGQTGIEASHEKQLRGKRGQVITYRDGRAEDRDEPRTHTDVKSALDIRLQARVHALMSPEVGLMKRQSWHGDTAEVRPDLPLNGAAVVMKIETGEVLALVSQPTLDLHLLEASPQEIWNDRWNQPWVNRAVARPYQAGSTVKPLVLAAAITDGQYEAGHTIDCKGYFEKYGTGKYRCWHYKLVGFGHGPLDAANATGRSCNIFFSTLAMQMGGARLIEWYEQFGMDRLTEIELPEEVSGFLPSRMDKKTGRPTPFNDADAILMGIGQGRVSWTPLQAATAYARLVRRDKYIYPRIASLHIRNRNRNSEVWPVPENALKQVLEGMYKSVHDAAGTTSHLRSGEPIFNIENVKLFAKSGTAQIGKEWIDLNGDEVKQEDETQNWGNHAWCVVLVQKPTSNVPDYVIVVVVEYGGSGGSVAGPVANQILHAMRNEGYL